MDNDEVDGGDDDGMRGAVCTRSFSSVFLEFTEPSTWDGGSGAVHVQEAFSEALSAGGGQGERRGELLEALQGEGDTWRCILPCELGQNFQGCSGQCLCVRFVQFPVVVKEYAAISSVHFEACEPYDYAVTTGSRVSAVACSSGLSIEADAL